jgi:hypothetical protein
MTHHKGTVSVCQYPPDSNARENTPPPPNPPPTLDSIDRRLVLRYGAWLLTGGYTAIPTYAWMYYARLGVSEAEMVLIAQLCTYWWDARDPYPGEAALAARMGKTVRTIQGYIRSLEAKGLLHIETRLSQNGQHQTNSYDLRPFFAAVEGLARLDGLLDDAPATNGATNGATPATLGSSPRAAGDSYGRRAHPRGDTAACKIGPGDHNSGADSDAERRPLCAGARSSGTENRPNEGGAAAAEEGEGSRAGGAKNLSPQVNPVEVETFDYDSIPPTPTPPKLGNARFRTTASADNHGPQLPGVAVPAHPANPDGQALAAEIAALAAELGDDAPASSTTRASNLQRAAGVPLDRFLRLLDEAAARTRDRQTSIVKRRRDGETPNGMPYLFAVLQDLLHPAPPPARRQAGLPDRRRRRRGSGRGEPTDSYAAWSDSPAPLPIVETHPVWRAVLDDLAQVMTSENFNAWLATTRVLDQDSEVLRVAVPAAFNKTWLEQKLAGKVAAALQKINCDALHAERVARVEYIVDPTACVPTDATARAS